MPYTNGNCVIYAIVDGKRVFRSVVLVQKGKTLIPVQVVVCILVGYGKTLGKCSDTTDQKVDDISLLSLHKRPE